MVSTSNTRKAIFALMLVLFIDGMGQGLIFPILTSTITNIHSNVLLHHASQHSRDIWYGALVSVYFLMWFLGAAVLGDWSDNVGRKKALMVCLALAGVGFLLSALAFQIQSLVLLLFARFIGGLTSGDQAIAQASVIDLCDPEKKPVYLGLVLLSVTLGLVVGPLIGAYLINPHIVSWFNLKTPFYFAAILTVINIFLLQVFFKETHPNKKKHKLEWTRAVHVFIDAFRYKSIRFLLAAYVLGQLGWAMFYVYTPNFLATKFNLSTSHIAWYIACIGVGLGIGLGLLPSLIKGISHKRLGALGYGFIAITSIIFVISTHMLPLWIVIIPAAALLGLAYANILALFSEAVSSKRQGWIMGVTGSVIALSAGIDSLISGPLANINLHLPYVYAAVVIVIGVLLLLGYKHQNLSSSAS